MRRCNNINEIFQVSLLAPVLDSSCNLHRQHTTSGITALLQHTKVSIYTCGQSPSRERVSKVDGEAALELTYYTI